MDNHQHPGHRPGFRKLHQYGCRYHGTATERRGRGLWLELGNHRFGHSQLLPLWRYVRSHHWLAGRPIRLSPDAISCRDHVHSQPALAKPSHRNLAFLRLFGILLSLTQSLAMVPLMAAVSGWFRRRLGVGVGLLWGAGGAGTAVMAPVIGGFIEAMGWQSTFMLIGAIGGGTMLCLVPFMRNKPADIGIQPYGARPADAPMIVRDKTVDRLRQKVFNQHTRKTKPFWNLPLIHALGCAGHGTVLIYVIPMAIDRGAFSSLAQAGIILTIIALISVISRIVTPIMAEAYGTRKMMAASL